MREVPGSIPGAALSSLIVWLCGTQSASAVVRYSARWAQAWGCEASGSPCVSLNLKGVTREPMSSGESSQMFPMVKGWVCECACVCATGNRSPLCATSDVTHFAVAWSHCDLRRMHQPGIEPGSHRWQRCILPLDHGCKCPFQNQVVNMFYPCMGRSAQPCAHQR